MPGAGTSSLASGRVNVDQDALYDPNSWAFDHLGVVVKNLAKARSSLSETFAITNWTTPLTDPINGVYLQFGRDPAGMVYELLQPINDASPVFAALSAGRAILNHVAYLVGDLDAGAERLRSAGSGPASDPKPAVAYGGARIQFFVTPLRFIVELIEAPRHIHIYELAASAAPLSPARPRHPGKA